MDTSIEENHHFHENLVDKSQCQQTFTCLRNIDNTMDLELEYSSPFMREILSDDNTLWYHAVYNIKNSIIGNDKQKQYYMRCGIVNRLIQFLLEDFVGQDLKHQTVILLGSFAHNPDNLQDLLEVGLISILLKEIQRDDEKYVTSCCRCLRTIMISKLAPVDVIFRNDNLLPHLLSLLNGSDTLKESVASILASCCIQSEQQLMLFNCQAVPALQPLLSSNRYKVQLSALRCFTQMCFMNQPVSHAVIQTIPNELSSLLQSDKTSEMQMQAAKCLTHICRAGAIDQSDKIISHRTLPTLISLCRNDKTWEERVEAAETLAYLIELDTELQCTASISDHILSTLADYFKYPGRPVDSNLMPTKKDDITVGNELRQAAFRAFSSLGANDEDIRKRVIETEGLMKHLLHALSDPVTKVQLAAIRCMHSLSRSVQQLRTNFHDHAVWRPVMEILKQGPEEVVVLASSTLCNLLLDFSPSKEPILEVGVLEMLASLIDRENAALRLNGIWALMNVSFQAEEKVKMEILSYLGEERLSKLLRDPDSNILMKTLGLLRNLLSHKIHIDNIMQLHGQKIIHSVLTILDGEQSNSIKEQALCILVNVADGDLSKSFIMVESSILKKLVSYMKATSVPLQVAATLCMTNLVWSEEKGATDRQEQLRKLGVEDVLKLLLKSQNASVSDKAKIALHQFC